MTLLSLTCLLGLGWFSAGCKQERLPTNAQTQLQKEMAAEPPSRFVEPPHIDDAQLVVTRCGHPRSDAVLPIYDKMNNGPVRRMVYTGRSGGRAVTFNFIPSHPVARVMNSPAPFPAPAHLQPQLPADSVWRFDDAWMEKEEMLSSARIEVYLPCAADALKKEY